MGPFKWFLFVYVLGGLTFVPLLIVSVLLYAYYTLPPPEVKTEKPKSNDDPAQLLRPEDDKIAFKTGTDDLAEQFHRKHDSDVAAGYFAVCREYVPGGVPGKPPDKLTPAGDVAAQESPSVYQSMYRSIFDRSQKPTIEPNKEGAGKNVRKTNNVFYVVLRHGHLMLYDDIQQLEVRYVISLDYHDVDVYAGGEEIPEGELWIKRNAIRLRRKKTQVGDKATSLPFFLFGQSQSDKEDFYDAILKNQEKSSTEEPPGPQLFDVEHIVLLVQKLHSSEEHLQTRWLNAMIGRVFLAMYKTPELEGFIREKLTKKISRVRKPTFITKLGLRKIDLGTGAPFFTNPRLKDLTVNGDCTVEADVNYSGGVRIEIAATARIDLGTRFKAREVDMVLAVTCKALQGHLLVRCKPPPSNRFWFTFEKMPVLELDIEPIVSTRQITYTFILRAIESRIREVVAESIVHPFWDDVPFFDTRHQKYRGGIWKTEPASTTTTEIPDEEPEDAIEAGGSGTDTPAELSRDDRVMSMPVLAETNGMGKNNSAKKSMASLNDLFGKKKPETAEKADSSTPRLMRSTSFASAADPTITTNHADANTPTRGADQTTHRESVATILKDLSARSVSGNGSELGSPAASPSVESAMAAALKGRTSSNASGVSEDEDQDSRGASSLPRTLTNASRASTQTTDSGGQKDGRPASAQEKSKPSKGFTLGARSLTAADRKQALASVNAAAAAAQKWGWGVLARNRQRDAQAAATQGNLDGASGSPPTPREPMGRGRPLPPPGVPLPPPERVRPNSFLAPKRKAVPPPMLPKRPETDGSHESISAKSSPKPPLPERRKRTSSAQPEDGAEDEVFVVEAPMESAPTSPANDEHHDDFFGHGEPPATTKEQLKASPLLDNGSEVDEPAAVLAREHPNPPQSDQESETEEPAAVQEQIRPPLPARGSTTPEQLLQDENEMHRQEMGMYT
ncbi:putative integral membrane protein conserved domain-containing protein [Cladophialophora immunda]|nr:putative integral membrane protein conserved domain-containing protein [Cladophialophora immunda]